MPPLAALGVTDPVPDPRLEIFKLASAIGENDNWGGGAATTAVFAQVGAFALATGASRDAALYWPALTAGNHSIQISGVAGATGAVLAEIYDATPGGDFTTTTPRLINGSVLKHIGPGLSVGFVIGGVGPKSVLIRAIGPELVAFGVGDALADPQLELFDGAGLSLGSNDNWGGTQRLESTFVQVGAFALPSGSRDAALLMLLPPGNYSTLVRGAGGTTGSALIEIYEVP